MRKTEGQSTQTFGHRWVKISCSFISMRIKIYRWNLWQVYLTRLSEANAYFNTWDFVKSRPHLILAEAGGLEAEISRTQSKDTT